MITGIVAIDAFTYFFNAIPATSDKDFQWIGGSSTRDNSMFSLGIGDTLGSPQYLG